MKISGAMPHPALGKLVDKKRRNQIAPRLGQTWLDHALADPGAIAKMEFLHFDVHYLAMLFAVLDP